MFISSKELLYWRWFYIKDMEFISFIVLIEGSIRNGLDGNN